MPARLTRNAYGKDAVRLVKVERRGSRNDVHELAVEFRLEGEFASAYAEGDNSRLLPTDSMKNAVYAMARRGPVTPPEAFAEALGRHLLAACPAADRAAVTVEVRDWRRARVGGAPHDTAFEAGTAERRLATVRVGDIGLEVEAGLAGLQLIKTADSGFAGFLRDRFTTLPETDDRLLATVVEAWWRYRPAPADLDAAWHAVREALVDTFCTHRSASVQHTLYAMGESALARCRELAQVRLILPNRHHQAVDLTPFELDNPGEVFVPLAEPSGHIEAVIARAGGD